MKSLHLYGVINGMDGLEEVMVEEVNGNLNIFERNDVVMKVIYFEVWYIEEV